jgi:hypothetical protein
VQRAQTRREHESKESGVGTVTGMTELSTRDSETRAKGMKDDDGNTQHTGDEENHNRHCI